MSLLIANEALDSFQFLIRRVALTVLLLIIVFLFIISFLLSFLGKCSAVARSCSWLLSFIVFVE